MKSVLTEFTDWIGLKYHKVKKEETIYLLILSSSHLLECYDVLWAKNVIILLMLNSLKRNSSQSHTVNTLVFEINKKKKKSIE